MGANSRLGAYSNKYGVLLSAPAISFLGSSPKVPPELSRSEGRVGEDPGNEVVSSRSSSARTTAGGNGSFYLAAEILNS